MGEEWRFNGATYAAISIEPLTVETRSIGGGALMEAETTVEIRETIQTMSGVRKGSKIEIPDNVERRSFTMVRVMQIGRPRDGSVTLFCGPVGVEGPR